FRFRVQKKKAWHPPPPTWLPVLSSERGRQDGMLLLFGGQPSRARRVLSRHSRRRKGNYDRLSIAMNTCSTEKAAKLIGISQITLCRWLSKAVIRPSIAIPMHGKTLWRWTPADIRRAKKLRGVFKPGPKPEARRKRT